MSKYTITDEELKIWARLETYSELENDKEAIQLLRKLISREKSWRKLKEAVEKYMSENTKEIAQGIINITENTYSQMLEMFGELEEEDNDE